MPGANHSRVEGSKPLSWRRSQQHNSWRTTTYSTVLFSRHSSTMIMYCRVEYVTSPLSCISRADRPGLSGFPMLLWLSCSSRAWSRRSLASIWAIGRAPALAVAAAAPCQSDHHDSPPMRCGYAMNATWRLMRSIQFAPSPWECQETMFLSMCSLWLILNDPSHTCQSQSDACRCVCTSHVQ